VFECHSLNHWLQSLESYCLYDSQTPDEFPLATIDNICFAFSCYILNQMKYICSFAMSSSTIKYIKILFNYGMMIVPAQDKITMTSI